MTSWFSITDGTNAINFFGKNSPYYLESWLPATPPYKNSGIWSGTGLSDGKQLLSLSRDNIIDTFTISIKADCQDNAIAYVRQLRSMLDKAVLYWTNKGSNTPVWLVVRGKCETETRYAIIYNYSLTGDNNPYAPPFGGNTNPSAVADMTLTIEHGYWQELPPGQVKCVPLSAGKCWGYPYVLYFFLTGSYINCGSDASIDDVHANAFTAEAWIRPTDLVTQGVIIQQANASLTTGWQFCLDSANGLWGQVVCATTNASTTYSGLSINNWYHVAMTWDNNADRKIGLFVNGIQVAYGTTAGGGAIVSAASENLTIGGHASGNNYHGYMGWVRLSNTVLYTGNFTPTRRDVIPNPTSTTLGIWIREGQGTTVDNYQGASSRDGSIAGSNYSWVDGCSW